MSRLPSDLTRTIKRLGVSHAVMLRAFIMTTQMKVIRVLNDAKAFEAELNKASEETKSWATQTHVFGENGNVVFVAVMFYGAR
jgi:hypothetical protein